VRRLAIRSSLTHSKLPDFLLIHQSLQLIRGK
jgi:hypothetical protein